MQQPYKKLSPLEAKKKIYHYCAYQERSHQEVKSKLYDFGLPSYEVDEMISHLITEGYLNEERFAKAFAGGKFRLKSWGRLKIIQALEGKGLTKNCIASGLKEIDESDYIKTVETLIEKKTKQIAEENPFIKRDKLAAYIIQKGFEPELVWRIIKERIK
ncbi:regulatory protein RecX [Chryseolinea sp. H1M3-3]|uniref:regulatory protein RecX n=1 Tax=Chryseolinea sp. H1M3-3 TaxID=3034144 RepID=UPI0023EB5916|nr:regulatory protein RecX [Chryseolinea sp. H1M3-3]